MSTPLLPDYIRVSKYALHLATEQRRETWGEQLDRKFKMHGDRYGDRLDPIRADIDHARSMMDDKRVLGSQRVLQFGGKPIFKQNARVYNCTVSFCDRPRFFQECFHLLLCGCGTGFSVQKHHVAKMSPLQKPMEHSNRVYQIPDTIEGWADSLGVLMSSYMTGIVPFPEYQGCDVTFDPSLIRPKGSPISSGAKAPGPDPLMRALMHIEALLIRCAAKGTKLRPIDAYDIVMFASDAVLAGGVRRSASIAMFSPDDMEMATAKTGSWMKYNPQRQRSNNSAVLLRNETSWADFNKLVAMAKEFGEPGFVWTDSTEMVVNPCVEIGMWPVWTDDTGVEHSGWQMCNLSTINGALCDTPERFYEACHAAAVLGTLQAGYARFPYLGEVTEQIVRREALLGVSITGMMDNPDVLFSPEVLRTGAGIVKKYNAIIAKAIGINKAARATCLKPEGTSSCMLDTCSGVHPWHSRRGIRHVRANVMEPPFQYFRAINPQAVFKLPETDPNYDNTQIIAFPYEVRDEALTKAEIGAIDLLERVILVRKHWVETGTREHLCAQPWLRHNVSNTIHIGPGEWDEVARFIYDNREHFAGVALMAQYGDKVWENAPFMSVMTPEEMRAEFGTDATAEALDLNALLPESFGGLWAACAHLTTAISMGATTEEAEWLGLVLALADTHFSRDAMRATMALKEAHALGLWSGLMESVREVDWTGMVEYEDTVDFAGSVACGGGSSEAVYT